MSRKKSKLIDPNPYPAWNIGDDIEIIASGMRGICIAPANMACTLWNVELCTLAGVRMGRHTYVPAREMRKWYPETARYAGA